MARHFDRERELHGRIDAVLASVLADIDAVEVELNDSQEKVTVYIDRAAGIGIEHCEAVTHAIRETCPDHELEVSSPGIERPLRRPAHFQSHIGEPMRLRQQGHHRASVVKLLEVDETDGITVQPEGGQARVVPFEQIVRCKLVVKDPFAAAVAQRKDQA